MNKLIISVIAGASLSSLATPSLADVELSSRHQNAFPKNEAIVSCVNAIKAFHNKEARLTLKHRAKARQLGDRQVMSIEGSVWKNGERVSVSHECSSTAFGDLALNVVFAGETQVAER